jgi:hypothetical protein
MRNRNQSDWSATAIRSVGSRPASAGAATTRAPPDAGRRRPGMRSTPIAEQKAVGPHHTEWSRNMAKKRIIITDITPSDEKLTDEELRLIKGGQRGDPAPGSSKTAFVSGKTDTDVDF